jgi:hypothetical protein
MHVPHSLAAARPGSFILKRCADAKKRANSKERPVANQEQFRRTALAASWRFAFVAADGNAASYDTASLLPLGGPA